LKTEIPVSQKLSRHFTYDVQGHICEIKEQGEDGILHETHFTYDNLGRCIQKQDPFQRVTQFSYDPCTSQITQTEFPPIISLEGTSAPVLTTATYDSLERVKTKSDENGHTISYRYNAYNSPTEIHYPDGSCEYFFYTKKGLLAGHTEQNGVTTLLSYDVLDRIVSKTYLFNEEEIAKETFNYNNLYLLSETNKEGNTTYYTYDYAGRKTEEEFCGRVTEYAYNSLGQLSTLCKRNGENTLIIHYKRDLLGRVIEETKTDTAGRLLSKITTSYGKDGNVEKVTHYLGDREATEEFAYDSLDRLIRHIDAEGLSTHIHYDEQEINLLGQRVLKITTTDPLHTRTVEIQDAFGRPVRKEKWSPTGEVLSCEESTYDPHGNLLRQITSSETLHYTYTPTHQVASIAKDLEKTVYSYFPSGKIATEKLPSGITLTYTYFPFGLIKRIDSSDGKIHYSYTYTQGGILQTAQDEVQHLSIRREIDPFGNLLREISPLGFEIQKEYDAFDRVTSLMIENQGIILYQYDPLYLRKVTRLSKGKELYTHTYDTYDSDGHLLSESLIQNLGSVFYTLNPKGETIGITSPYSSYSLNSPSEKKRPSHQTTTSYVYDSLHRITERIVGPRRWDFVYDPLGRPLSKTTYTLTSQGWRGPLRELYLYDGDREIATFKTMEECKRLTVFGLAPIAIEENGQIFAPLLDPQGQIRGLLDPLTKTVQEFSKD